MNHNSVICELIAANENWRDILAEKKIRLKEEGSLMICNYLPGADFFDPAVQEARGIIIDLEELTPVCWPFRKFGNWQEPYADEIDWGSARVQQKLDGSIMKLWWDKRKNEWQWSTNSVIRAEEAQNNNGVLFSSLIKSACDYQDIIRAEEDFLKKDCTYIFELVSPLNQIVVRYPVTRLFHIGTRNNVTGREMDVDIRVIKPYEYDLGSLAQIEEFGNHLNDGSDYPSVEGFVVVDKNWNRVKVKTRMYLDFHHRINNGNISKQAVLEDILEGRTANEILERYPQGRRIVMYYLWQFEEMLDGIDKAVHYARALYEEFSHERKAVAMSLLRGKDVRYNAFAFAGLENQKTVVQLVRESGVRQIIKLIPDYPA